MNEVLFRCPRDRRTMFGKLFRGLAPFSESSDYMEFACAECRRILGKRGLMVKLVLHRYTLEGEFLGTEHVGQR